MLFYSALLVGLLGSFHCVGMCGPIAFALPLKKRNLWHILLSRIFYNLGRIFTYALLGGIVGLAGRGLLLSSSQQWLSILIGLGILVFWLLPSSISHRFGFLQPFQKLNFWVKQKFSALFRQKSISSYLLVGLLNGFLPCGLVYLALAGAIATGEVVDGMLYMALFGLGTFPTMLVVSLLGNFVKPRFKSLIYKRLLPGFTILLAFLFILRGLNLGIPYISPEIHVHQSHVEVECCHPSSK